MDHGVIEQIGTPEEIYMAPRSTFVSDFVGETNSVPISVSGGRALFFDRAIAVPFSRLTEGPANLHFRPHDAELCDDEAGCLPDRQSVGSGKSVSVRVDLGGRGLYKKKKNIK